MAALIRRNPRIPILRSLFSTTTTPLPGQLSAVTSAILAESDPDRIADLFQSSAHLPEFHKQRPIYRLAVRKLAESRRHDLIERLLDRQISDLAAPKPVGFLTRVITLYSAAGMVDHAVRTFDSIPHPRPHQSLCALLSAFFDNGQFDRLIETFEKAPVTPSTIPHNILLKTLCAKDDMAAARKLLDEMPSRGVKPDIVSYTTVLDAYRKKGDEAGFEEVLKMISDEGLKPSVTIYKCRIMALCMNGRSSAAEALLDVMDSRGLRPSWKRFNILIGGFCREGDLGSAMRVLRKMRAMKRGEDGEDASLNFETSGVLLRGLVEKGELDFETSVLLLQGLVEKGEFCSALEICEECLVKKWSPPFKVVKELIEWLVNESRVDDARGIAEKMRSTQSGNAADSWKKIEAAFSF